MNNKWNKFIYKIWSPFYDLFFNRGLFLSARKKVFAEIDLPEGSRVLFVGTGTGADIEFFDDRTLEITAIDYSSDMLQKARDKFRDSNVEFLQMDAQDLDFPHGSFDFIVCSLVLSVVPNPLACLQETHRVLRNGGTIFVFDKFSSNQKPSSISKKILRQVIRILGTDIGLDHTDLLGNMKDELSVEKDEPVMLKGMYRKIVLMKLK
ncbi:class I SAM-dependent methyltransferase [Bacillus salacetis]|uniref:class I SAM-dependent methyltransferase n=1 Tax=Bacillus salacetis TaxID=2315464 RepID=UPI003BA1CFC1